MRKVYGCLWDREREADAIPDGHLALRLSVVLQEEDETTVTGVARKVRSQY